MTKHFGSAQKWDPPTPGSQSLEASTASSVGGMKPAAQGTLFYEFGLELTHRRHQKTKSPIPSGTDAVPGEYRGLRQRGSPPVLRPRVPRKQRGRIPSESEAE